MWFMIIYEYRPYGNSDWQYQFNGYTRRLYSYKFLITVQYYNWRGDTGGLIWPKNYSLLKNLIGFLFSNGIVLKKSDIAGAVVIL